MIFSIHTVAVLVAASTNVYGHVIARDTWPSPGAMGFIHPAPRAYNAADAGTRPCQTSTVSSNRTYIPLSGANFWILSQTEVENISFNYADAEDPTDQTQFTKWEALTGLTAGDECIPSPNFADLGFAFGDKLTLQIVYATEANSGSKLYQCADIELISAHDYTAPSYTCSNTSTVWSDSDKTSTSAAAAVTVTAGSSGKLSPLAAGWIGAVVALVVAGIVLTAATMLGGIAISARRNRRSSFRVQEPIQLRSQPSLSVDDISLHRKTTVDHKAGL